MAMKGKVALFSFDGATVDITDAANGKTVQQHDVEGKIGFSAAVQGNVAVIAVSEPYKYVYDGVHVMDLVSGKVLFKFILPNGENARVTLSKDAQTLGVGSDTGVS